MDSVFLDASVLFSAAYRPGAKFVRLWNLPQVRLLTSTYAAEEAYRNLGEAEQRERLSKLLETVELTSAVRFEPLPDWVHLPAKDEPILQAAIAANATHLLTSDLKHFGCYFWQIIEGVTILPPTGYLRKKQS
jgi:predicted nucleic acid-binding protein